MENHRITQEAIQNTLGPQNHQQMDFPPLSNLKISPIPNSQNSKTNPPLNFAAALGGNGGNGARRKIRLPHRPYDLKEGKPVVSFSKEENDMLADTCKLTLIGKFTKIRPSIEKIRDDFKTTILLKGYVKIGAYNMHHIFLDFNLEEDHRNVHGRNFLTLCNMQMKLLKWKLDFRHEVETTLAPVWINLPDLRWHFFEWGCTLQNSIISKTRPTTTKIKVEIDITKPQISEIQIAITNEDGAISQRVEYENVPDYCFNCKAQGHSDDNCRILHPELRGSGNTCNTNEMQMPQQKIIKDSEGVSMIPNGMLNGRNESSPTKRDKICESEDKNKLSEDDEGWTTVSKGKGKIKNPGNNAQGNQKNITTENQGNNDQGNQKNIATKNQFVFPPNEVANMTNDRQGETSNSYGITFTAQEKTNLENIFSNIGKRKVTATPRWLQENANQAVVRKERMQKKAVETFNPHMKEARKGIRKKGTKKMRNKWTTTQTAQFTTTRRKRITT
ncbi:hypothetical protein H5410_062462 [Solanum commersonii]|uniref:DUF4283 domain-containing protein n=1 Tax=Solanum commersonii TaxID=4109 RepID=A0A9J5WCE0_SOLCO|nr:hypothetical protein H5410_062462 [Solanum commersonii]